MLPVARIAHGTTVMAHAPDSSITADDALHRLIEGNARYRAGHSRFTGMRPEMLTELAHGQQPFATILGCADSRVPPELIFDAVLGELFVVRVAGNVMSPEIAGSLQYAGSHLDTPLFVVFGHEGCGAVRAALESQHQGVQHRSRIQHLVDAILPALGGVDGTLEPQAQLTQAVEANVRWTMQQIAESPEGRARLEAGHMLLIGAIYDLATGHVRLLDLA
jgi:carbonic anhydrase